MEGHGHHSHHHHHHHPASLPTRRLLSVAALTLAVFLAELVGGLISGSLALLADAGHMVTDSAGLVMALVAMLIGKRAPDQRTTYGYRRVEVLTALANGLTVFLIAGFILWSAVQRFGSAEQSHIQTTQMLAIAVIGLVTNVVAAIVLTAPSRESVNVRGAYLHVLVDAAGSVAVIVSALIIAATGWTAVDSVVSIIIALVLVPRAWQLIRECLDILLERTPRGIDTAAITADLGALDGVIEVHDLHIWTLSGTDAMASAHLVIAEELSSGSEHTLLDRAQLLLHDAYGIEHATVQIEKAGHSDHEYPAHG